MSICSSSPGATALLPSLKRLTAIVYLCQVLTFSLLGLPLLVGIALNYYKQKEVEGTWLESHFKSQLQTAWIVLAGGAFSILTFPIGIGFLTLLVTLGWMMYRTALGWYTLIDNKPVDNRLSRDWFN